MKVPTVMITCRSCQDDVTIPIAYQPGMSWRVWVTITDEIVLYTFCLRCNEPYRKIIESTTLDQLIMAGAKIVRTEQPPILEPLTENEVNDMIIDLATSDYIDSL